jgi:DNA polymerase III epsilon subunit-like protein
VKVDLETPLASAEFLVVDTETNGLAGEACELTEVGAVLVGGGELHDRWETLVGVRTPLSRGIQRFTGITQAMVDAAPPAEVALPDFGELVADRVLVAHNAGFDRRVLRQAFARAGMTWPDPPFLCTLALARRFHPLARQRALRPLAESLGVEVECSHRALADAETCARVFCALFPRLCASATVHSVGGSGHANPARSKAWRSTRRSNAALWATSTRVGGEPMSSARSGRIASAGGASSTIVCEIWVKRWIARDSGAAPPTSVSQRSCSSPPPTSTAPTSVSSHCSRARPFVSVSRARNSAVASGWASRAAAGMRTLGHTPRAGRPARPVARGPAHASPRCG